MAIKGLVAVKRSTFSFISLYAIVILSQVAQAVILNHIMSDKALIFPFRKNYS